MTKINSFLALVATLFFLTGCQSIDDIDLKSKDPACAELCYKRYDECVGRVTLMPIRKHNDCVDNLRFCAQQCPVPKSADAPTDSISAGAKKLEALNSLKKKGLITQQDYEAKKKQILDGM